MSLTRLPQSKIEDLREKEEIDYMLYLRKPFAVPTLFALSLDSELISKRTAQERPFTSREYTNFLAYLHQGGL